MDVEYLDEKINIEKYVFDNQAIEELPVKKKPKATQTFHYLPIDAYSQRVRPVRRLTLEEMRSLDLKI